MIKKIAIIASLMVAVASAQAVEVGVNGGTNLSSRENAWGLTLGEKVFRQDLTLGFNRSTTADLYSLTNTIQITKIGPVGVGVKFGGVYVDTASSSDGYAALAGATLSMPIVKNVTGVVDYTYQSGQDSVSAQNGSRITAGIKYRF